MRPRLHFALTLLLAFTMRLSYARAGEGVFLVRGNATSEIRAAASEATLVVLRQQRWAIASRPYTEEEVERVARCLERDRPWPCIAAVLGGQRIEQLAIISVEDTATPEGAALTQLTTRVVTAAQDLAYGDQYYCERCNAERVKLAAGALATKVLKSAYLNSNRTLLEIRSTPRGAHVAVDGVVVGASDLTFEVLPGRHAITLSLPGHRDASRSVELADGEVATVEVSLERERSSPSASVGARTSLVTEKETSPLLPRWVGPSLTATGAVAVAVGGILLVSDTRQPEGELQREYNWSTRSMVLLAAGALATGGGIYLWRWPPVQERRAKLVSSLSAAPLHGGGLAVFITRF